MKKYIKIVAVQFDINIVAKNSPDATASTLQQI